MHRLALACLFILIFSSARVQESPSVERLLETLFSPSFLDRVETDFGPAARARMLNWQQLIKQAKNLPDDAKLKRVNDFFNKMAFVSDQELWGRPDYWATPVEFIGKNAGDCEDYSIAKFFTLIAVGISTDQLRLIYVKALRLNQAHMVLGYYQTPKSIPLILDNLNTNILPASQRKDLEPVYSFNGNGLWHAKAAGLGRQVSDNINDITLVTDLIYRLERGYVLPGARG